MDSVRQILKSFGFRFNKALGQNFITDANLLSAIVEDAKIKPDDLVVEIGTGAGTLTRELAKAAKRVVTFEVDEHLKPVLGETLKGSDNVEVVFADVLKLKDADVEGLVSGSFELVANLPYYITTNLIMRFAESTLPVRSMTVMVQSEVADRLVAAPNTSEYGAITASLALWGEARRVRNVSRELFFPQPNVDSAIVRIERRDTYADCDVASVRKVIKAAFHMRRKTLSNNLMSSYGVSRDTAEKLIGELGEYAPGVRGEVLGVEQFVKLDALLKRAL